MTAFLLYLLKAGAAGGAAALAAWALCALLRKARTPGWLLCAVWLAVGLRFAAPGGLIPVALPRPQNPALAGAAAAVTEAAKTLAAAPAQTGRALTLVRLEAAEAAPAAALPGPAFWGALLWMVGTAVLLARAVYSHARLRRQVALACKTADGCYTCEAVRTPFTLGMLRPRIYLPPGLQGPDRAAVLRHERTHIRRGDTLTKPLFYALACLHWWNPLAWLAFRQFERAAEQACDEAAVCGATPAERTAYCESLLRFAVRGGTPGALAFGQGGVRGRILHALRYRAPGRAALALCAAAAVLAGAVLLAQPTLAEAPQAPAATPSPAPTAAPAATPAPAAQAAQAAAFDPGTGFALPVEYDYIIRFYNVLYHKGDDLAAAKGTPVTAAAGGTVTEAGFHYAYGNYVIIDHGADAEGHTWQTLYAHLDTIDTETGRQTAQGDRIGTVGSTGNSTGNHLHFEIRRDGALMPPQFFLPYSGTLLGQKDQSSGLLDLLRDPAMLQIAIEKAGAQNLAFDGRLTAPLEMYLSVSSAFSDAHTGLDLAADEGAPVRAAAGGVVLAAGYDWDMGNYVLLYHGTGADGRACATLYGAMQAQGLPAPGQTVAAGEEIGRCGNSGRSTGPHLHVEVWLDGAPADPAKQMEL